MLCNEGFELIYKTLFTVEQIVYTCTMFKSLLDHFVQTHAHIQNCI